jgi:hypothetical protein
MKASFRDFIAHNPNCKKYDGNPEAIHIFENILSKDDNIIAMIDATEANKPALSACIQEVENYYKNLPSPTFDLTDNFTKQALGRMVKTILEPFGYQPDTQKDMPKSCSAEFVTSATVYKYVGNATMMVVRKIDRIDRIGIGYIG